MDSDDELDELQTLGFNIDNLDPSQPKLPKNYKAIVDRIEEKYSKYQSQPHLEGLYNLSTGEVFDVVKRPGEDDDDDDEDLSSTSTDTESESESSRMFANSLNESSINSSLVLHNNKGNQTNIVKTIMPTVSITPSVTVGQPVIQSSLNKLVTLARSTGSSGCFSYSEEELSFAPRYTKCNAAPVSLLPTSKLHDVNHQLECLKVLENLISAADEKSVPVIQKLIRKIFMAIGLPQLPTSDSKGFHPFIFFNNDDDFSVSIIFETPMSQGAFIPYFIDQMFPPEYMKLQKKIYSLIETFYRVSICQEDEDEIEEVILDQQIIQIHKKNDEAQVLEKIDILPVGQQKYMTSTPLPKSIAKVATICAPQSSIQAQNDSSQMKASIVKNKRGRKSLKEIAEKLDAPSSEIQASNEPIVKKKRGRKSLKELAEVANQAKSTIAYADNSIGRPNDRLKEQPKAQPVSKKCKPTSLMSRRMVTRTAAKELSLSALSATSL